jgi:DNA-binding MarR family transcriptional regulator/N-acetylglutamate synthase-like GNAT family acetyltransferase
MSGTAIATEKPGDCHVAAVRRFNRFYTQRIGVLQFGWGESPFSLAEARVLYELSRRDQLTASAIGQELGLDAGYLSRILRGFAARGLIAKARSRADGRQVLLTLTARGRKAFAPLDDYSDAEVGKMLHGLAAGEQRRLVAAMQEIEELLHGGGQTGAVVLRPHRAGDMGWIVSRHGALYAQEYGWDERLEALCADIVAAFLRNFDSDRERCWIAERDGEALGTVMLVKETAQVARLRLLLVEPKARGLGLGLQLVEECIRFAREAGYRKITLWTHSVLTAARHVYRKTRFKLVDKKAHDEFGKRLVGETWELDL